MITGHISVKKIIADVFRDLDISGSDWIYNAIEWISFALGELGGSYHTTLTSKTVSAVNHRVKLPCNSKVIKQIIYEGYPLDKFNTINIEENDITSVPFWNDMNVSYITTSFETGEITIYYYTVATELDTDTGINMPLIPDDGTMQVRIFLQEYILMKYLGKGNKHVVRNYQEVKQGIYSPYGLLGKAQNAVKFPSPVELANLTHVFNKWYTDLRRPGTENYNSETTQ